MNTIALCDQLKPIGIGENLAVNYLTIRIRAPVFYEQIVNEVQLVENEDE